MLIYGFYVIVNTTWSPSLRRRNVSKEYNAKNSDLTKPTRGVSDTHLGVDKGSKSNLISITYTYYPRIVVRNPTSCFSPHILKLYALHAPWLRLCNGVKVFVNANTKILRIKHLHIYSFTIHLLAYGRRPFWVTCIYIHSACYKVTKYLYYIVVFNYICLPPIHFKNLGIVAATTEFAPRVCRWRAYSSLFPHSDGYVSNCTKSISSKGYNVWPLERCTRE